MNRSAETAHRPRSDGGDAAETPTARRFDVVSLAPPSSQGGEVRRHLIQRCHHRSFPPTSQQGFRPTHRSIHRSEPGVIEIDPPDAFREVVLADILER